MSAVDSVAITVSDTDRAVDFYSRVLTFEKVADREVAGEEYEHLFGVFGVRIRAVRMRLGDEYIELLQFLAPRGRPIASTRAATIAGSSTSPSSCATWAPRMLACAASMLSMHPADRSGCRLEPQCGRNRGVLFP